MKYVFQTFARLQYMTYRLKGHCLLIIDYLVRDNLIICLDLIYFEFHCKTCE